MRYVPIRNTVWRPLQRTCAEQREPPGRIDSRREYISETFSPLSKLIDADEYENMLSQWGLGFERSGSRTGA